MILLEVQTCDTSAGESRRCDLGNEGLRDFANAGGEARGASKSES